MSPQFVRLLAIFLVSAPCATAALAHARLLKSTPAAGAVATVSPAEIRLQFSEGVEPRFSGIVLTADGGAPTPTGRFRLIPAIGPC